MLLEKLIKMAAQLGTMVLLARFLGAEGMGNLMYCYAIASIFIFLNNFGLNSLMIKWLSEDPSGIRNCLTQTLLIRLVAALACVILTNLVGLLMVDDNSRMLLLVISLYHLVMPVSVVEWYFQSIGRASLSAYGLITGSIVGFVIRATALYLGADILWLGAAYTVELISVVLIYSLIWKYKGISLESGNSNLRIGQMINQSLPLLLSGAVIMLYMRIDQLMLGYMVGDKEVGIYSAALRLSEAWYFVGLTILGVYFPKFLQVRKEYGENLYLQNIVKIGRFVVWGAFFLAIVTTLLSDWIIQIFYGNDFVESAEVLVVSIWAVIFVYMGTISSQMFVANGQQMLQLYRSIFALLINVVLNYLLIPLYGACGAAIALLVAQVFSGLIFNIFGSWQVFKLQLSILYLHRLGKA